MGKAPKAARNNAMQSGFTIIEVLIVLAIAGLILLIVFEAIPALERSGRNNQRRQDVTSILQAVSNYELNHSGTMPQTASSDLAPFLQQSNELTYYTDLTNSIIITTFTNQTILSTPSQAPKTDTDKVYIYDYQRCDADGSGGSNDNSAGYNDVVALYALETGSSGVSSQCQQL
jgi:prepilin-type N-terminal cleavage/methylation domain-containing protein